MRFTFQTIILSLPSRVRTAVARGKRLAVPGEFHSVGDHSRLYLKTSFSSVDDSRLGSNAIVAWLR